MPVTVNALPAAPAAISGAATGCQSGVVALSDITPGGAWSSANTAVATINGSGLLSGVSAGTVTISYTAINGCGSTAVTKMITVNPLPLPAVITGSTFVLCAGDTTRLSDAVTGGTWISSSLATATIGYTTGLVSAVDGGSSTITYTVTNDCGAAQVIALFTVNPLPAVPTVITGTPLLCIGGNTALTETVAGGVWTSTTTSVATVDTAGIVSGVDTGMSAIVYTITNTCGTTTISKEVSVNMLPTAAAIGGTPVVCEQTTIHLGDLTTGGTWSSSNTAIAMVGDTGTVSGVNAGSAVITYNVTNNCGTALATVNVVVNPQPHAGIITGEGSVCAGDTIMLTENTTGGVWTTSSGLASVTGAGVVTGVTAGTDTVRFVVANSCGTDTAMISIDVRSHHDCVSVGVSQAPGSPEQLKVYPNPSDGAFEVNLVSDIDEPVRVTVTNIVGEKLQESLTATNTTLNVKLNQPAGIYFVTAATATSRYVVKVVVQ